MTAGLPGAFEARMRELLGPEAPAFLDSYRRAAHRAVRANPGKLDPAALPGLLGIPPDPVPWCPEAWFLPEGVRVGDTLAHAAGLCYVQEPSALAVGEALDVRPGQRVLDLAAAPGGKATQVAGRLGGHGVVVANEVQRSRVQALADNLDRWGSARTVLAGEAVARLAAALPGEFDRVLLDAPCSGEGLFRRNPAAAAQWRPGHVSGSAERQRGLLADAARLVRPGGALVYSTCTFAPEENEQQVATFLAANPGWELLPLPMHPGFAPGRPEWAPGGPPELSRTVRLWPHRLRGEGHFIAKLTRPPAAPADQGSLPASPENQGSLPASPEDQGNLPFPRERGNLPPRSRGPRRGKVADRNREGVGSSTGPREVLEAWRGFAAETLEDAPPEVTVVGERVYSVPDPGLAGAGVRLVRPGLLLGRVRPGRFEPAHALAMAVEVGTPRRTREVEDQEAAAFVRGETLVTGRATGWTVVTWNGWPLGWGRAAGGTLKNHYPKGLRTMRPARA
jgi:16S rRNA C967 or C1407 C5-methylase (RsmB/RsmF family)/NOL1/NOP2/fmu family ribosome biogenesis protein